MEERQQKTKRWGLFMGGFFAILTLSMAIAYWITGNSIMPNPVFFDPTTPSTQYAYIDMYLLTECFAYSEDNGKIEDCFYFVLDNTGAPSIVHMSDEQFSSHRDIVDFTYSDAEIGPDPVRITGIPRSLDAELSALAVEAFNELWQQDYITEDSAKEYFGSMYLDCTSDALQEAQSNILVFGFLFFVLSLTCFVMTHVRNRKPAKIWPSMAIADTYDDSDDTF